MEAKGEASYITERAPFDVLVLTLNEPPVDWEELRLMEEWMSLSRTSE
jgi:hypothetical protein